ncbi:response regulator transcription factor [Clostridium botulinum]|uniref:Stage 0 sporulation protein A homolog n=1 Tax=Clostridium botulinum (strain Eklund 17B / Type B) TaxID=935198 RepID=B2TPY3_CLOBB|nr:response regulator transcription factor [Clostridium sp. ZBS20]ACD21850.1 regulatory protein VanR [Clostridium botulinum B str. Eklund 17B (NRP)]MBN1053202.1 DNA-binding response regulator [Clostridium botulinum]MBY6975443.1 response regulator transcription factor [Clostridium botulinum]MBY7000992.1 response regulator transcription factor [Clostridium botulinum]MCR1273760.1 response regulator transcription factor [Clostridium botulinum]
MIGNKTILIVDDEKEIRDLVEIYLKSEGYATVKACNGEEALNIIREQNIDLVILDVMMPKLNGIDTCLKIREEREMPIIMLSAKSEGIDKILGLNMGADDYITKPFNPLELVARVKSQLRRFYKFNTKHMEDEKEEESIIEIDELIINLETHEVILSNNLVKLTPTEFDILLLLSKNRGKVFSIENIYESVWNQEFMSSDNTVMVHIRKIREKIESDPRTPKFIKTVWGVGYKIEK